MKRYGVIVISLAIAVSGLSCTDKGTNPASPDFSKFQWIDLDGTVSGMSYGTQNVNVQARFVRREEYKEGSMSIVFDSSLNEYIPSCSPLPGALVCPSYYRYYIVDSLWMTASPEEKFHHRLELRKVVLPDTVIQNALQHTSTSASDPSIPKLDSFLDRMLYSSIVIEKKRVLAPDGINYHDVVKVDIGGTWIK